MELHIFRVFEGDQNQLQFFENLGKCSLHICCNPAPPTRARDPPKQVGRGAHSWRKPSHPERRLIQKRQTQVFSRVYEKLLSLVEIYALLCQSCNALLTEKPTRVAETWNICIKSWKTTTYGRVLTRSRANHPGILGDLCWWPKICDSYTIFALGCWIIRPPIQWYS